MRPLQFYRLGMALAQGTPPDPLQESLQRTVISRLYYGLHHEACCRYFRKNPLSGPLRRNRRHTDLRDRFNRDVDPISRTVGTLLRVLKELREEADYQLAPPLRFRNRSMDARQFMDLAVEHSLQLLDALETYSPGEAEDGCDCPVVYASG